MPGRVDEVEKIMVQAPKISEQKSARPAKQRGPCARDAELVPGGCQAGRLPGQLPGPNFSGIFGLFRSRLYRPYVGPLLGG